MCVFILKTRAFDCGCNFLLHDPFNGKMRQIAKISVILIVSCLFIGLLIYFRLHSY